MSLSKWPEPRSTMATCSIKLQIFKKLPGTELPSGMAVLPEQILVAELVGVTRNLMKRLEGIHYMYCHYNLSLDKVTSAGSVTVPERP